MRIRVKSLTDDTITGPLPPPLGVTGDPGYVVNLPINMPVKVSVQRQVFQDQTETQPLPANQFAPLGGLTGPTTSLLLIVTMGSAANLSPVFAVAKIKLQASSVPFNTTLQSPASGVSSISVASASRGMENDNLSP